MYFSTPCTYSQTDGFWLDAYPGTRSQFSFGPSWKFSPEKCEAMTRSQSPSRS